MKMKLLFIVALFILLSFGNAFADCKYAGQDYPEGTIINGYTCNADGTWG